MLGLVNIQICPRSLPSVPTQSMGVKWVAVGEPVSGPFCSPMRTSDLPLAALNQSSSPSPIDVETRSCGRVTEPGVMEENVPAVSGEPVSAPAAPRATAVYEPSRSPGDRAATLAATMPDTSPNGQYAAGFASSTTER